MPNTQHSLWPYTVSQNASKLVKILCFVSYLNSPHSVLLNVIKHGLEFLTHYLKSTHCISHVLMLFTLFLVNLDDGKKKWFLEFYKRMCNCGNPNKNNRVGSVTLALQV